MKDVTTDCEELGQQELLFRGKIISIFSRNDVSGGVSPTRSFTRWTSKRIPISAHLNQ